MWKWTQTLTAKVLGIGLLALIMLIPLAQVRELIAERQQLRETTISRIAEGWGGRQTLGAPVLRVPTRRVIDRADGKPPEVQPGSESMLADQLQADIQLSVQTRSYGMYSAPLYAAAVHLSGRFMPEDLAQYSSLGIAQWQDAKAELLLPIADLRGLRDVDDVRINGRPVRFRSSGTRVAGLPAITVPIDLSALDGKPIEFDLHLTLAGAASLQLLPLARSTDVRMRAPWRDPSFTGATLPLERSVGEQGFSARWHMLDINRSFGQWWVDGDPGVDNAMSASSFGVELYQPVSVYQRNERAGKYGLLFVALTFVAFFLVEVLRKLRVHPVQYLLVGAALVTFYVLLLALSEQIGFAPAYLVAAAAVVLIVGGYAAAVLRARRAGLLLGGVLALVYAMLYGLIATEQYALLIGALVLLATVTLMMYLTRRIDWYAYAPTIPPTPVPPAAMMERP